MQNFKKKQRRESSDDDKYIDDLEVNELFWTEEERRIYKKGWFIPKGIQRKGCAMDLYKTIQTGNKRCDVTGRIVHIPASYWGRKESIVRFGKKNSMKRD